MKYIIYFIFSTVLFSCGDGPPPHSDTHSSLNSSQSDTLAGNRTRVVFISSDKRSGREWDIKEQIGNIVNSGKWEVLRIDWHRDNWGNLESAELYYKQ